jgi:YD repeat-containing protein
MKVFYDPEVDVLSVLLSDAPVAESDPDKAGVILDYDANGNMVSFEILDASKRMSNPMSVEYAVTPPRHRQP